MRTLKCIKQHLVLLAAVGVVSSVASAALARGPARNVILFVGDGMGVATVTAARILDGQNRGQPGEENFLAFEQFPHLALVKTYNVDAQVPDSAGTMTALITGRKARQGMVSVGPEALRGDCRAAAQHRLTTLLEEAEQRGLRTGIVTTTHLTHATPAATYAHAAERDWESDADVPEADRTACPDIARQFAEFSHGDGVDVALGGGRAKFLPVTAADPEDTDKTGQRLDGRDLIAEWLAARADRRFVHDRPGFDALTDSGQVLGLFAHLHMEYEADRVGDIGGEPSLAEMTRFAIKRLQNESGFFLMVEGGRIDLAHHAGNAYRALTDTIAFADAVAAAVAMTDAAQTLILVTADHSHVLTIAGYPPRGNPILGFTGEVDDSGVPYTTLGYANGPGAEQPAEELDPTHPDYRQRATHPLDLETRGGETHGGEDVAAYALGPGAEGVHGVMDQHELHGVMWVALFGEDG